MTLFLALSTLGSANAWRYASALIAILVLFGIVVALVAFGHELLKSWRRVIALVAVQQLVLAYAAVVRAKSTPAGFPDQAVDVPLIAIVVSALGLALAVVGVFSGRRSSPRE